MCNQGNIVTCHFLPRDVLKKSTMNCPVCNWTSRGHLQWNKALDILQSAWPRNIPTSKMKELFRVLFLHSPFLIFSLSAFMFDSLTMCSAGVPERLLCLQTVQCAALFAVLGYNLCFAIFELQLFFCQHAIKYAEHWSSIFVTPMHTRNRSADTHTYIYIQYHI